MPLSNIHTHSHHNESFRGPLWVFVSCTRTLWYADCERLQCLKVSHSTLSVLLNLLCKALYLKRKEWKESLMCTFSQRHTSSCFFSLLKTFAFLTFPILRTDRKTSMSQNSPEQERGKVCQVSVNWKQTFFSLFWRLQFNVCVLNLSWKYTANIWESVVTKFISPHQWRDMFSKWVSLWNKKSLKSL